MAISKDEWRELLEKYQLGRVVLEEELKQLFTEFIDEHGYNPVEHLKSRIKSAESIEEKMEKRNIVSTFSNIEENINDIIGIRIVCSFLTDVYDLVALISGLETISVIKRKDYISNPKNTGYSSYHLIVLVPIVYRGKKEYVKAEIQIRTSAMDFWASLNHKIQYKFPAEIPSQVKDAMYEYSLIVQQLDKKMVSLNDLVREHE